MNVKSGPKALFNSAASYAGAGFSLAAAQNYWLRFTDGTYQTAADVNCWTYVDFNGCDKALFCWECQLTNAGGWGGTTQGTTHVGVIGIGVPPRAPGELVVRPDVTKVAPTDVSANKRAVGAILEGRSLDSVNQTQALLSGANVLHKNSIVFDGVAAANTDSIIVPWWVMTRGTADRAIGGNGLPYTEATFGVQGMAGMWLAMTFNTAGAWAPAPATIVHSSRLSVALLG